MAVDRIDRDEIVSLAPKLKNAAGLAAPTARRESGVQTRAASTR
jgi:hypothetical protein